MRGTAAVILLLLVSAVFGVSTSRQAAADTYPPLDFPRERDTWEVTHDPQWGVVGDHVNGTRYVDITKFNKTNTLVIYLDLELNTLPADYGLTFNVSLNGEQVGTFSISGSDALAPNKTIPLGSELILTESRLDIRYEVEKRIDSGTIIIKKDGSSTLTLCDGLALAPKTKKDYALLARDKLKELRGGVDESIIDRVLKHSLLSKLDSAIAKMDKALVYIDNDNERQANNRLRSAKNSAGSFIRALDAFSKTGRIAPQYAEYWDNEATNIISLIEKAIETPL